MEGTSARVLAEIDMRQEGMVSLLQDLVREPSTLGNERSAQEIIHAKWKSIGLESELWQPSIEMLCTHPAFAPVEWDYADRPNVTAVLRSPTRRGRSLILNGHIDVVSPEPTSAWTYHPWQPQIVHRRMYGRGTADMKGGIVMMALALEALRASRVVLDADVIAESVIEEECSGNGTLACRLAGYNGEAAIVCEPHALKANIATMGVMWFRVTVRGSGAHVLRAHQAVNAIEKCFPLISALRRLEEEMNQSLDHPLYRKLEHPINLNVGKMHGGDWPSNVPALCQFDCRISYPPGTLPDEVRQQIEARLAHAASEDAWLRQVQPTVTYYGFRADGSQVDPDCQLARTLGECHQEVVRAEMEFDVTTACNDMRYFANYFGIPAVAYGPAGGELHGADEYVELDSIVTGAKVLSRFIMEWCGVVDGNSGFNRPAQE
jgi:acetylornithine deacetylase